MDVYQMEEDEENRNQELLTYVLREYKPMENFVQAFHRTKDDLRIYRVESKTELPLWHKLHQEQINRDEKQRMQRTAVKL